MKAKNLVSNEIYTPITGMIKLLKEEHLDNIQGFVVNQLMCECVAMNANNEESCDECCGLGEVQEYQEVLGYYLVSNWMARRLRAYGEYVSEIEEWNVWHRTEANQPVEADYVIQKIADDLKFI